MVLSIGDVGMVPACPEEAVLPFLAILDIFHPEKRAGAEERRYQAQPQCLLLSQLRGSHRPGHCETAKNEDRGVQRAEVFVQKVVGVDKNFRMIRAIDGIRAKESAKKEDFRHQEDPHPQFAGRKLLGHGVEMMGQVCRMLTCMVIVFPSWVMLFRNFNGVCCHRHRRKNGELTFRKTGILNTRNHESHIAVRILFSPHVIAVWRTQ